MLDPTSLTGARLDAGMSIEDLSARAAAIGHRWHARFPEQERGTLREDLEVYIRLAELGDVADPDNVWFLPPTHPYLRWIAEALDTTPLRLIDSPPVKAGGGHPHERKPKNRAIWKISPQNLKASFDVA